MAHYRPGEARSSRAGRKKGVPNKAAGELKSWCQRLVQDPVYRAKLTADFQARRKCQEMEKLIWYYAAGKPREEQHVTGSLGPLVQVITKGNPIRRLESTGDLPDDVPRP